MNKQVIQRTMDGTFVRIWPTAIATRAGGFDNGAVSRCCSGERPHHRGYQWHFVEYAKKYCKGCKSELAVNRSWHCLDCIRKMKEARYRVLVERLTEKPLDTFIFPFGMIGYNPDTGVVIRD